MAGERTLVAAIAASLLAVAGAGGADAQTPKRGGMVVFGNFLAEPACLNVVVSRCNSTFGPAQLALVHIVEKVLLPAFEVGPDLTYRPSLVSDVTFTKTPPFTLTYHIRPEARWSDGVSVSAHDFRFTHRARVALKAELQDFERADLGRVRSVTVLDAKTIRVVLRSRFAAWRRLFGNILPRHALRGTSIGAIWSGDIVDPRTGRPIASGPFLVERWHRGRELTLSRNPRYWGPQRARVDRITLRFRLEGQDPLEWFAPGGVDLAHLGTVAPAIPALAREPGIRVVQPVGFRWEHLALRLELGGHPALRSKLVRQALAYGIDRTAIARIWNLPVLNSVLFVAQSRSYRANWQEYRRRPSLARRLLERAGCRAETDGIRSCQGRRLSLRFVTTGGVAQRERTLALVQGYLRQVGVEVVPVYGTTAAVFTRILPSGEFDAALFNWGHTPNASGKEIFGCGGESNYMGYCQRLVTRDLDQAERILDAAQRARALNRADAQLAKDVPVIPLIQVPVPYALRTTLRSVDLSGFNPLMNAEDWWLDD